MFCPKCGALLIPKKDNNRKVLACSCGYKSKEFANPKITEVVRDTAKDITVVDREDAETLPLTEVECPNCGNREAYYWLVQTRAADEPETKFLRCKKCRHTWRDYS